MDCYCDFTLATAYWATRPVARTEHRCNECGHKILPGERYERVRAIHDGEPHTVRTCVHCLALRDLIESRASCWCWEHTGMIEDAKEWLSECDIPGMRMAAGRILVEAKRDREAVI